MKKIIIRFNAPVILSFALLSLIALLLAKWIRELRHIFLGAADVFC